MHAENHFQRVLSSPERKPTMTASSCVFWYMGHGPTPGSILQPNPPTHTHTHTPLPFLLLRGLIESYTTNNPAVSDCPRSDQAASTDTPLTEQKAASYPHKGACVRVCPGTQGKDQWEMEGPPGFLGGGRC